MQTFAVINILGVGKSTLVNLICHNNVVESPAWTVGVALDVKLHVYREPTPNQRSYWVELWDVGGNNSHSNTRKCLYSGFNGKSPGK